MEQMQHISREILEHAQRAMQAQQEAAMSTGQLKMKGVGGCKYEVDRENKEHKKILEICGIFERYQNCTFEAIEGRGIPDVVQKKYTVLKNYANNIEQHIKSGSGLVFNGPCGTMKTSLAVAVLQELIKTGRRGFFVTMPSLLDTIFTLKQRNLDDWLAFETKMRATQLLILDDLGAEYETGWVLNKVDSIISERYNRCRSVIVTTNLTSEEMKSTYAERIIDRLRSTCKILTFTGRSLRENA